MQFDSATAHIVDRLETYGLDEVEVLEYPADGETMFGTQKSRPVWDVRFAELWELETVNGQAIRKRRLGDWSSVPLSLAQDSLSGEATTTLVDIGAGQSDADYAGKDIRGKLVLTSSQPGAVAERAVGELGAAGIISYAPNQRSAWWLEDDRLVRWGTPLELSRSRDFRLHDLSGRGAQAATTYGRGVRRSCCIAKVDASHETGTYQFATAAINGTDKAHEDIHFTCHLDHPRPGANDNASGCVSILEVARTLNTLVRNGHVAAAATHDSLSLAGRDRRQHHLSRRASRRRQYPGKHSHGHGRRRSCDQVVGSGYPAGQSACLSFISDLGHEVGHFVNEQTEAFTSGSAVDFPLTAPEGGKEPLMAMMEGLDMGSDHDVFFEGTWRIPGLYLHDWAGSLHPYELRSRAAQHRSDQAKARRVHRCSVRVVPGEHVGGRRTRCPETCSSGTRSAEPLRCLSIGRNMSPPDQIAVTDIHFTVERRKVHSVEPFAALNESDHAAAVDFLGPGRAVGRGAAGRKRRRR